MITSCSTVPNWPVFHTSWYFLDIPDLGSATLMTGHIIDVHSNSDSVHSGRRYFSFEEILEYNACYTSCIDELPTLTFAPHSNAANVCSLIMVLLFPSGSTHTPSIFKASWACSCFSETYPPTNFLATKSIPTSASFATHFPLFQKNSIKHHQLFFYT